MSLSTLNPSVNTSPDPGQGGAAVTGNTNTGHSNTTSSGTNGTDQTKTCIWRDIPDISAPKTSVDLKLSWSASGSVDGSASVGGFATADIQFKLEYSLNGGGAWTTITLQNKTVSVTNGDSGSDSLNVPNQDVVIPLSISQDITQIRVRDSIIAQTDRNGAPSTCGASVTAQVSNIRVEVQINDTNSVVSLMM